MSLDLFSLASIRRVPEALDDKFSGISGKYFDGFKEILSSVESRDESKAQKVWEESAKLARLLPQETGYYSAAEA